MKLIAARVEELGRHRSAISTIENRVLLDSNNYSDQEFIAYFLYLLLGRQFEIEQHLGGHRFGDRVFVPEILRHFTLRHLKPLGVCLFRPVGAAMVLDRKSVV